MEVRSLESKSSILSTPATKPPAWEWLAVLVLLTGFLAFNLATCNYYPNVWCDEVWFSEPAVNFVQNGSFTTTTWQFQPGNTFPTVNCPLYSMTLVPWLKLMGTTLLAVRSFNYSLMGVAGFLIWLISWRFDLVKSSRLRLLMVVVLHLGYGISFAYRCSRPDILGLVSLALLALGFQIQRRLLRESCLFILAAITIWIGLQVSLFAWFTCAAAWLIMRRNTFRELMVLSIGMSFGLASLLLLFAAKGVLVYFLPMVVGWLGKRYAHAPQLSFSTRLSNVLRDSLASSVDDFTTLALSLGLLVILVIAWKHFSPRSRKFLSFMLLLILATPVLFNLVGHYAFYYSYARFVPAVLAFFAAWSALANDRIGRARHSVCAVDPQKPVNSEFPAQAGAHGVTRPAISSTQLLPPTRSFALRLIFYATAMAAMVVGLPMRLAVALTSSNLKPRHELQTFVNSSVRSNDVVFSDDALFFEVKKATPVVYGKNYSSAFLQLHIQGHDFSDEEKRSINVLVIRPEQAEFATNFFRGTWQLASGPLGDTQDFSELARLPVVGPRLAHYGTQPQTQRYQLQIFRRLSPLEQ
jgi:hypothetical protein